MFAIDSFVEIRDLPDRVEFNGCKGYVVAKQTGEMEGYYTVKIKLDESECEKYFLGENLIAAERAIVLHAKVATEEEVEVGAEDKAEVGAEEEAEVGAGEEAEVSAEEEAEDAAAHDAQVLAEVAGKEEAAAKGISTALTVQELQDQLDTVNVKLRLAEQEKSQMQQEKLDKAEELLEDFKERERDRKAEEKEMRKNEQLRLEIKKIELESRKIELESNKAEFTGDRKSRNRSVQDLDDDSDDYLSNMPVQKKMRGAANDSRSEHRFKAFLGRLNNTDVERINHQLKVFGLDNLRRHVQSTNPGFFGNRKPSRFEMGAAYCFLFPERVP